MVSRPPQSYTIYIAATPDKVWEGFTSKESNRVIFMGADFEVDLQPGGRIAWTGPDKDGKIIDYVFGKVLRSDPPKALHYTFALGHQDKFSRVTIELTPETEATKVVVMHDEWGEDDPNYDFCLDGWPRILSRLKTLIETGKTFKPH